MATPTGAEVAERLESVRNSMIDLFFVALLDAEEGSARGQPKDKVSKTYRVRIRL